MSFSFNILIAIFPVVDQKKGIKAHLETLEALEFIKQTDRSKDMWEFRHASMFEVPYMLLTDSQRQQMHKRIANWYRLKVANISQNYSIIAAHYDKGFDWKSAVYFYELAADSGIY